MTRPDELGDDGDELSEGDRLAAEARAMFRERLKTTTRADLRRIMQDSVTETRARHAKRKGKA